jgi:O-antigen ligase
LALGLAFALLPLTTVTALVLGAAIVLLVTVRPLLGVALMLLAGPWGALEAIVLGSSLLDSGQVLFLLTLAAWLARGAARRRIVLPHTPLNLPLALFLGVTTLTLVRAPSVQFGVKELLKWAEMGLVMLLVVDLVTERAGEPGAGAGAVFGLSGRGRWLVFIVLLAGLSQALIGIWQFGLRATGPEHFQILGGRFYRAYGTFEQPNPFGGFMAWNAALGIGAVVGLMMAWKRESTSQWILWGLFVGLSAVATTLALVFSWSRGAWLSFAAARAAIWFFWLRRRPWGGAVLCLVALAVLLGWQLNLLPAPVVSRVSSFTGDVRLADVRGVDVNDANYAVLERLAHWQSALGMARENLWLGVGFGNYEAAYDEYALLNWPAALGHAHNYYLNILAEAGVLGLLSYLLFWGVVFFQTIRMLSVLDWPERGLALGLLAAWIALSVHHLLDKLYVNNLYLHLGGMLGILQVLEHARYSKD